MTSKIEVIPMKLQRSPSLLVRVGFGGSYIAFALYLVLVSIGIICVHRGHDPTVLWLSLFLLLSSMEIYREHQVRIRNELNKNKIDS